MTPPTDSESRETKGSDRTSIALLVAFVVVSAILLTFEVPRLRAAIDDERGGMSWLVGINIDTTLYLILLLVAPLFWFTRLTIFNRQRPGLLSLASWFDPKSKPSGTADTWAGWQVWIGALIVGATSLGVSYLIADTSLPGAQTPQFGDLPPAYHDEYSYLFQTKTFLAGRLSFPSHQTNPELFDQMHVLNIDGHFASRYFPGTGAWLAPFLALGKPSWGQWLAGAVTAMFIFWSGRELGGNGVGFLAGMLTALSPGMGLFSNLLLAHHPTLMGLSLFTFTFLRMLRTRRWMYAFFAGVGLSFAMLCRPMTAAGFGLPFGIWFFGWLWRAKFPAGTSRSLRRHFFVPMAVPITAGIVMLFVQNGATTGSIWTTPYQVYTDRYSPRHVYGFNNRVRGEKRLGPHVIENYDEWAENLTPTLAVENVKQRFVAGWQWTLGIIPLVAGGIVFLIAVPGNDRRWWLLPASILSLHAAHVPYWFVGIMNWHYVFETGPLWLLMYAGATGALFGYWRRTDHPWMPLWWSGLTAAAILTSFASYEPFWSQSRLQAAIGEVGYPRRKYELFRQLVERTDPDNRILLLITADPADRSMDYVVNDPALDARVLRARYRPKQRDLEELRRNFPDRLLYTFDARKPIEQWRIIRVPK